MSPFYDAFLSNIPSNGMILDLGCGSGRDLKYFKEHGYRAEGLDASNELCKLAETYSGCPVTCSTIQNFISPKKYDGIWACASLLHLTNEELYDFFKHIGSILKPGGTFFASMKSGIQTGNDSNNRFFINFTEDTLNCILEENPSLELKNSWYTGDTLNRSGFRWLNFILCFK